MKMTDKQRQHLLVLADGGWRPAYPGLRLGTLNSLSLKKMVEARHNLGSMVNPQNGIKWRITPAGRAALSKGE